MAMMVGLILSGCYPAENGSGLGTPTETPVQAFVTATHTLMVETEPSTPEPPIASPDLVEEEATINPFEAIACGEIFCWAEWPGLLERPVQLQESNTIDLTYLYASTRHNTLPPHHGIEFLDPFGTPVFAAAPGEVVFAGTDDHLHLGPYFGFYGEVVILRHSDLYIDARDVYTLYGHLSHIHVSEGQVVKTGELVGEIGFTGFAEGPHLHFEVRIDENDYLNTVNPILWFKPLQSAVIGEKAIIAGVINNFHGDPVPQFEMALEKLGPDMETRRYFYPKTYTMNGTNPHPWLDENFAFPDIPAGDYRLSFIVGRLFEYYFTLEPGSLGFIKIQFE